MKRSRAMERRWTVMVYMAGDNNLDPEGVLDLKEMKKVGSTDQVAIVAQFDRAAGHVARRYYLRKGASVISDAVVSVGAVNTGDPECLSDFIRWGIEHYPAEHYLLVLWNHGQGWDDTDIFADERFRSARRLASGSIRHALFHSSARRMLQNAADNQIARAILLDDDAKDFLDNSELKEVMADTKTRLGRKIDVLGMDACLMSMAEVGYQVCRSVGIAVGSEQTEPAQGWPYDAVLGELAARPEMTPEEVGVMVVSKYLDSYQANAGVTCSACDLEQADALADAVAGLSSVLKRKLADPSAVQMVQSARGKVQSYEVPDNVDLADFCELLSVGDPDNAIRTACGTVTRAIRDSYVLRQGYKGKGMCHSNGVAICFPLDSVSPLYPKLDFCKRTGWHSFLKAYLAAVTWRG